jgi:hypothetical protein
MLQFLLIYILVIALHGLGRFVNVYWCALTNQIPHVTSGDLYVPTTFGGENPFKDERMLNHARARTRGA